MSELKTIEQKIKKFLINHSLSYYFYKIFKLFKNKRKGNYFGEFGEDILINRFFRKKDNGGIKKILKLSPEILIFG